MIKQDILKLNRNFFPVATSSWKKAITDIFSGAAYPIDITYGFDDNNVIDKSIVESMVVVKTWDEWVNLPIRDYDEYIHTARSVCRLPAVVVAAKYDKIPKKETIFPTKHNIMKRDNWTCQYTGKKLSKSEANIDHINPVSRGGRNTWENMVCCSKELNTWKADRTPSECGLKLITRPRKPANGHTSTVLDFMRKEWETFLYGGKSEFSE